MSAWSDDSASSTNDSVPDDTLLDAAPTDDSAPNEKVSLKALTASASQESFQTTWEQFRITLPQQNPETENAEEKNEEYLEMKPLRSKWSSLNLSSSRRPSLP